VPSPVPVSVEESASLRLLVWMTLLMGVAAGVNWLSLVWVGVLVDMLDVIARPLEWRELSVAVREAARLAR